MLIASGLLVLLVGAAFAVLLSSVADLRARERRARQSEEVLEVADVLERQVVDLETTQRGFVITREERLLGPWRPWSSWTWRPGAAARAGRGGGLLRRRRGPGQRGQARPCLAAQVEAQARHGFLRLSVRDDGTRLQIDLPIQDRPSR
jgi:hypothetical protein